MSVAAGLEFAPAVTCTGEATVAFAAGVQMVTEGCCVSNVHASACTGVNSTGTNAASKRKRLKKYPEDKETSGFEIMCLGPE